jgi:hypothetical protein
MRIATRSGMRLYECDAHMEYARLELAQGKRGGCPRTPHTGHRAGRRDYHRRDEELQELKAALG